MTTQADEIKTLQHTVFGNGRPGLKTRMTIVETQQATTASLMKWLIGIAIPSSISLVVCAVTIVASIILK